MSVGMSDDTKKSSQGAAASNVDPLIGTVLGGRYRIDALLGEGAMGASTAPSTCSCASGSP